MEQYMIDNTSTTFSLRIDGFYFKKVHQKHVVSYGESGANNIVNNVVETYTNIQKQINDPHKNNNVLLVGKVQSGKTSNLELLTALAFDNGYNILIIYGGYDSSLLKQTTDRFKNTFDAEGEISYDEESPAVFTTDDSTQILSIDDEIMADLLDNKKPVIFVSMKRPAAMRKINNLLKKLDKSKFNAFIIDDEGDQASLNTAKDKEKNSSATYKQIKDMKNLLEDPMYLSVTATPQANIFLNSLSRLRPDSIRLIQPGNGYQGAEAYHIIENNIVEIVSDSEKDELENGSMPESLRDAIKYFVVASAMKCKSSESRKDKYSDMIIHAFREVLHHNTIYTWVEGYLGGLKSPFDYDDIEAQSHIFLELEECYNRYCDNALKSKYAFSELKDEIAQVIKKTKIILKNNVGKSTQGNENLKWHKIYIGGDLLQRGLTFKNLIVTYFTRWATSGGNMDTNLQRARWFGYRKKYIELCKIFTTAEIAQEFTSLAEIEDDLWDQFSEVEMGQLEISDILVRSDNTKQKPTSKNRVDYKKVNFKNRWIKQKYLIMDDAQIRTNNDAIDDLISKTSWNPTEVGSRNSNETALYAVLESETMKQLINIVQLVFDYEPFQKKALLDLFGQENVSVVLMWKSDDDSESRKRYRSLYPASNRIKALQQGADSSIADRITYEGDSNVIVNKDQINIQIHCIKPGYKGEQPLDSKTQYMFAIYIPKEKTYFIKDD